MNRPLPPPSASTAPSPPGWYPDPWRIAAYRWWDGRTWTANVAVATVGPRGTRPGRRRPRLPAWLSPPVLVAGVLVLPLLALAAITEPVVLALALVPLVFIVPVLWWIDRLEPEPWTSRLHALLWGGTVSVVVASVVNVTVLLTAGEAVAAVVSAPVVEELMKGLGIVWAVRRREVDGPVDGIVYAGWIGAGFAMVENLEYFLVAADDGLLAETFVARALLTPFAHPLFTAWIGLAVGLAVARRVRIPRAWWGLAIAIVLHAAWNGAIVAATSLEADLVLVVAMLGSVAVFGLTIVMVVVVRRAERRVYLAAMPYLAAHYGIPPAELGMFRTWAEMLAHRRRLPRRHRPRFDQTHAALARLAALHDRPGPTDPVDEARLVAQLHEARRAMSVDTTRSGTAG